MFPEDYPARYELVERCPHCDAPYPGMVEEHEYCTKCDQYRDEEGEY